MAQFPDVPEDNLYELFLGPGNGWVNVTSDLYNRDGCSLTRGFTSERASGAASPQSCGFTLKNHTGKYSPRNVLGPYYGSFGQNTPVRVSTRVVKDTFTRTVNDSWGGADTGDLWNYYYWSGAGASGADFDVASGKGTQVVSGTNQYRIATMQTLLYRDVEIRATVSLSTSDVTGGNVEPLNLILSGQGLAGAGGTDYFVLSMKVTASEAITVRLNHYDGTEIAPTTTLALTYTGAPLRAAFQMEGQVLRAKVWLASGPEPYAWDIEGSTAIDAYIDRPAGWVGIRSGVATGNTNTPVTFSYDDFEVRLNRYHGEVSSWPSQWDSSGNDVYIPIEAGGIRRRLSRGQASLVSPVTRANQDQKFVFDPGSPPHVLYYPVEDPSGSTVVASGLPNVAPMVITGAGKPQFGADSSYDGSAPFGKPNGSRWTSPVVNVAATGEVQLMFLLSTPSTGEVDLGTFTQLVCSGTIGYIDLFYHTGSGGDLEIKFYDQNRTLITSSGSLDVNVDGRPMIVSLELTQNGSNVDWKLAWFPKGDAAGTTTSGSVSTRTIGAPRQLLISPYTQITGSAIGHVMVRNDIISVFTFSPQLGGYAGEFVTSRVERLCQENDDIPIASYQSSIRAFTQVGVQGRKTLLDLLDEAVKADLGYLNESRNVIGFVHRYGRSLYNQDPVLTLDYDTGQVQPPFGQVDDDQLLVNDFTAKRTDGSSYRATQETGPLALTSPTNGAGVGRYADEQEYNVAFDGDLPDIATWKVHLGTNDAPRYPRVTVNLAKLAKVSKQLYVDALSVNLQDRIQIVNPKALIINGTISQIVPGYTENLAGKQHEITFVCVPGTPYEVVEVAKETGDSNPWVFRADTDGSVVTTAATAGATSLAVATPSGPPWTTAADDFPIYLDVNGVMVRATACANTNLANTDFEAGISPWVSFGASSFTQSSTQKHSGSFSGRIVPDGVTANVGVNSEKIGVTAGLKVTVSTWVWFTNTVTGNYCAGITWLDANNNSLGVSTAFVSATAATWTQVSNTFTAPAGAASAQVTAFLQGTPAAGQIWYIDDCSLTGPQRFTVDALPVARASGLPVSVWHLPVLAQ
ncbi:carbohydrate binding domain-containing protein [Amycolatopsis sp., V23-08]|uniref:Carbohydrate binding domain-containing protein n=1 Tax=Amycolatopsis heterodermiae TaxID=3110235 RepID=A0ABU5RII8_9PSEU|nr:carbohydrate binding domain-containing protein [Amycolatopsis sp., V23-08]MEA5366107.1 carbohydrate binding domain-containing protein [Amycolatopsis sp., V23-08]